MSWRPSDSSYTPWIAALLAASLLLVALLAVNASYAARSHRAVAEAVLRDYAALAGDELLRRVAAEVGYYGHLQALAVLREAGSDPGRSLGRASDAAGSRGQRALELVAWAFTLDLVDRRLLPIPASQAVDGDADAIAAWIADRAPAALARAAEGDLAVLQKAERTFVVAPLSPESPEPNAASSLVGFEVERSRLQPWIAGALDRRSLLPPSLGSGELGNEVLYLRVTDAAGTEILRRGERYASALRVVRRLPEDYLQPLAQLEVEAAVDPAAASELVIGGLPRSRLPVLLGLVVLTAGLFGAAVILLRRERAIARLKTDFVSRVSHELRTPLTQIRMFAETLRLGRIRDEGERARALEVIDRESRRLSVLVENVLRLSQAERGRVELSKERLGLHEFLSELVEQVTPLSVDSVDSVGAVDTAGDAAGIRLRIDAPVDAEILADPDALRQSMLNLLDNAIKYGPASQLVIVGAERAADWSRLWVDDQGPGIDPADRQRVWGAFRRAGNGGAVAGTGIGLAVVRELIELHGGRCGIESGSRGGTRVVLELPNEEPRPEAR